LPDDDEHESKGRRSMHSNDKIWAIVAFLEQLPDLLSENCKRMHTSDSLAGEKQCLIVQPYRR
jgi:hypothetical protein